MITQLFHEIYLFWMFNQCPPTTTIVDTILITITITHSICFL